MRFEIDSNILAQTCSMVQRAASTRDNLPVLSGLSIIASNNYISFSATDLEIGIKKTIECDTIQQPGQALVNAKYLSDLVRYLPDSQVTIAIEEKKSKLQVIYGRSSSSLNIYDPVDFPDLPLTKMTKICQLPQAVLKDSIKKTAIAAATNHFKPVFTGILFDFRDENLKIVASDTHRLSMVKQDNIKTAGQPGQFVVPSRAINELFRILEDSEEEICIGLAENNIIFFKESEGFYFLSRLIEGQYPNYNQVIPQDFTNTILVETNSIANSLERASLMPTDPKSIKNVQLDFSNEELIISAYSEKMGEMTEIIDNIKTENTPNLKISFNTRYLHDIVKILQGEREYIQFKLTGSMSPALINAPEDENFIYVLVPLRTG